MSALERVVHLASLEDERVADFRELREANLRRDACFIAESEVVLRVLVERGRFPIRSLLVAEPRLPRLADVIAELPAEIPVYAAAQPLLNAIAGFRLHRGILASADRLPVPDAETLLSQLPQDKPLRVVVLEGLTNHDNVGGVFRNAAAFGAAAVLYDRHCCDPLYRKAIRVSVGGALFVPFAREDSSTTLVDALRAHGFTSIALSPRRDAVALPQLSREHLGQRVALWLGSEGPGLSQRVMDSTDVVARIPMAAGFDSLNVGTTGGIALSTLYTLQTAGHADSA